jgi:hypothetical protein
MSWQARDADIQKAAEGKSEKRCEDGDEESHLPQYIKL